MVTAITCCRLQFALMLGILTCLFGTRSAASGQEQAYAREIRAPKGSVGGVVFTPDSKLLAIGAGSSIIVGRHQFAPLVKATVMEKMPAGARRDYVMAIVNRIHDGKQPVALAAELGAVKLLEELATKEARDILNRLRDGAEGARLTIAARAAVDRLKWKVAPN